MTYELRDNSGSAFKNRRKETDKHPDYTGEIKIEGQVYWLNIWIKTDKNGNPWYSLGVKKKDFSEAKKAVSNDIEDEIPF